jgi:hypothetical protein
VVNSTAGTFTLTLTDTSIGGRVTLSMKITGVSVNTSPVASTADNFLFGAGFQAGETIDVSVSPHGPIANFTATADTTGNFSFQSFHVANAAAGIYTFSAVGRTSGWTATADMASKALDPA